MKNTAILENIDTGLTKTALKQNCLSPHNNACSFLTKSSIKNNELLINGFQDTIIPTSEYQEKICSECIWSRKNIK